MSIKLTAPDLDLVTTGSETINLKTLSGKYIVLYFYPRDNTPGCTLEGQDFRDSYQQFKNLNCDIYGVSRDNLNSHHKFKQKFDFPFELIVDTDEQLCQHFDVIKQKNMYGKQVRGIERSTFLINPQGEIFKEWRKVKVKEHVAEVLATLQQLT